MQRLKKVLGAAEIYAPCKLFSEDGVLLTEMRSLDLVRYSVYSEAKVKSIALDDTDGKFAYYIEIYPLSTEELDEAQKRIHDNMVSIIRNFYDNEG